MIPIIGQAFFDDTGSHLKGSGMIRWIGLVATSHVWPTFQQRWCDVLNSYPPIYYWHTVSAHYNKLKDRFDQPIDLERFHRKEKELRLAQVIGDHSEYIVTIEISMDLAEHAEHVVGKVKPGETLLKLQPGLESVLEQPSFIVLRYTIVATAAMAHSWGSGESPNRPSFMWCVFEDTEAEWQDDVCFAVRSLRKVLKARDRKQIGPVVFLAGKGRGGAVALEAADLFAWHVNRLGADETNPPEPGWEHLSKLKRNKRRISIDDMQSMVRALNDGESL